jgi:hypothetical protein
VYWWGVEVDVREVFFLTILCIVVEWNNRENIKYASFVENWFYFGANKVSEYLSVFSQHQLSFHHCQKLYQSAELQEERDNPDLFDSLCHGRKFARQLHRIAVVFFFTSRYKTSKMPCGGSQEPKPNKMSRSADFSRGVKWGVKIHSQGQISASA